MFVNVLSVEIGMYSCSPYVGVFRGSRVSVSRAKSSCLPKSPRVSPPSSTQATTSPDVAPH